MPSIIRRPFPSRHCLTGGTVGGFSFVGWTSAVIVSLAAIRAAGNVALRRSGMLQGLYLTTMPGIAAVSPFIVEMWLEGLPSQVGVLRRHAHCWSEMVALRLLHVHAHHILYRKYFYVVRDFQETLECKTR